MWIIAFCFLWMMIFPVHLQGEKKPRNVSLEEILSIGSPEDDTLFMWVGIATDEDGHIYVTDAMDYSIKKIDSHGRLIKKAGRKGQGPGEFLAPRRIEYHDGLIYVTEEQGQGIQVFDEDLAYKDRIAFSLPIYDIKVAPDNRIYVASGAAAGLKGLVLVDPKGNSETGLINMANSKDFWSNWTRFEMDRSGHFYFASLFEDKIECLDRQMKKIWSRSLLGEKKLKFNKSKIKTGPAELPEGIVYKDIALDSYGNLFILGGHISQHSSRDIYILDSGGRYLLTLTLPESSHAIHFDHQNCLYSSAGMNTVIKKYQLKYQF